MVTLCSESAAPSQPVDTTTDSEAWDPPEESSAATDGSVVSASGAGSGPNESVLANVVEAMQTLTAGVESLSERGQRDQDLIRQMQSRIEVLQTGQVRALLVPVISELAKLHATAVEAGGHDYERIGAQRATQELSLLADQILDVIDLVGARSVQAEAGADFDSKLHSAVRAIPTGTQALNRTIAEVQRQGFQFDGDARPVLYARVKVYAFDPALSTSPDPVTAEDDASAGPGPSRADPVGDTDSPG